MRFPNETSNPVNARRQSFWPRCLIVGLLVCASVVGWRVVASPNNAERTDSTGTHTREAMETVEESPSPPHRFVVSIREPDGAPRVKTGRTDLHGNAISVSCSTCHTTRQPNPTNKASKDLDEFHGELKFSHGAISCLSCHNDQDYDSLKLADGRRVEFTKVMTLCAQCHGSQMKAYEHGAHGGMTGHWDLTRGPQVKNNCVDCHNPHTPQFPKMRPTFKPKDRFLEPPRTDH